MCMASFFPPVFHVARTYILLSAVYYTLSPCSLIVSFVSNSTHSWLGSFNSVLEGKDNVNTAFIPPQ